MKILQISTLILILLQIQIIFSVNGGEQKILDYAKKHRGNDQEVNIHLFPHSHTDVGWLKKIDEYLYGHRSFNEWMVGNATQTLNSVVSTLLKNEKYKFVWAEQAYFSRWYMNQNQNVKDAVKQLIKNKQFSLVGGGWVVNDEACTYFEDIIDQLTVGHQFLDSFLDYQPSMGWQQDPFGHSQTHAWIMSQTGVEGMMMSRIDYQEELYLLDKNQMQFMWQLPHDRQLFTMVGFYRYVAPENYEYDYRFTQYEYRQWKNTNHFALPDQFKSDNLAYFLRNVSMHYATDEFAYSLGNDFTYLDAEFSFTAYDEYIKNIESNPNLHSKVDYIRADDYMKILNKKQNTFEPYNKNDDFFPYRDDLGAYWTGYFTTLPKLKILTMENGRLLQKFRNFLNIEFLKFNISPIYEQFTGNEFSQNNLQNSFIKAQNQLLEFEQEMASMQHHDAVTGTCKQDVEQNYIDRVVTTRNKFLIVLNQIISKQAQIDLKSIIKDDDNIQFEWCKHDLHMNHQCQLKEDQEQIILNIQKYTKGTQKKLIEIQAHKDLENYKIVDLKKNKFIQGELLCLTHHQNLCTLYFEAELTPFQNNYFYLYKKDTDSSISLIQPKNSLENSPSQTLFKFQRDYSSLIFDKNQAFNFKYEQTKLKKIHEFNLSFKSYNKDKNYSGPNPTGAYLFRDYTNGAPTPHLDLKKSTQIFEYQGELISCLYFYVKSTSLQICQKKYNDYFQIQTHLEKLSQNEEIVLDLNFKDLKNNKKFQTDSNGLFRMDRELDRPHNKNYYKFQDDQDKIPGNFYPITKFLTIQDQQKRVTIFNDRSQAGSSLHEGNIQLMVQRAAGRDDGRGLGQTLQDYKDYILDHYLLFDHTENQEREIQQTLDYKEEIFQSSYKIQDIDSLEFANIISYTDQDDFINNKFLKNLPHTLKFTLKYQKNNEFLLRLQNFQDHNNITIDLQKIIDSSEYLQIVDEYNIQGTRTLQEIEKQNVQFYSSEDKQKQNPSSKNHFNDSQQFSKLTFRPLEIRAFKLKLNRNELFKQQENNNIGHQVWQREEKGQQLFCPLNCYEKGICVWNQCDCLRTYGQGCELSCKDQNCLKCNKDGICLKCDYDYTLNEDGTCNHIGTEQPEQENSQQQQETEQEQEENQRKEEIEKQKQELLKELKIKQQEKKQKEEAQKQIEQQQQETETQQQNEYSQNENNDQETEAQKQKEKQQKDIQHEVDTDSESESEQNNSEQQQTQTEQEEEEQNDEENEKQQQELQKEIERLEKLQKLEEEEERQKKLQKQKDEEERLQKLQRLQEEEKARKKQKELDRIKQEEEQEKQKELDRVKQEQEEQERQKQEEERKKQIEELQRKQQEQKQKLEDEEKLKKQEEGDNKQNENELKKKNDQMMSEKDLNEILKKSKELEKQNKSNQNTEDDDQKLLEKKSDDGDIGKINNSTNDNDGLALELRLIIIAGIIISAYMVIKFFTKKERYNQVSNYEEEDHNLIRDLENNRQMNL